MLRHLPSVMKLGRDNFFRVHSPKGFLDRSTSKLRRYYKAALFLSAYAKKFDVNMLLNAHYVTHWIDVDMSGKVNNDDLLDLAESLVKRYASAKMVITSRIHAALPCLATETPVVFVASEEVVSDSGTFNTPGRLGGLLGFFRTLVLNAGTFSTNDEVLAGIDKFNEDTTFQNKHDWKPYAEELARKASEFMSS